MTDHDPMCPANRASIIPTGCRCDLIAKVRADERERSPVVYERDLAPLADLRAKVEALRVHYHDDFAEQWNGALDRVLNLIDGEQ